MKITNTSIIILVLFVLIGCSSNKWNPHTQFAEDHFLYINTATGKMDSTISLAQYPKRNIIAIDYYCDSTLHINGTKIDTINRLWFYLIASTLFQIAILHFDIFT